MRLKKHAGSGRFSSPIPAARHQLFATLSARRSPPVSTGDYCLRIAISHRRDGTFPRATGHAFYVSFYTLGFVLIPSVSGRRLISEPGTPAESPPASPRLDEFRRLHLRTKTVEIAAAG